MQLTLVVPGLLDLVETQPARADAGGAALARLLATSPRPEVHDGAIGVACAALGVARQRDWPVAPLVAIAANLDPGDAYWLMAEPVTLLVGQLDVQLGAVVDDLSAGEAADLLATLNSHFCGDGLRFLAVTPACWLIASTSVQQLVTHPASDALGAPIFPFLPDGPDGARWRRWQSEMQMLLFAHPVANERERQGRAAVNGVWLSGGGVRVGEQAAPQIESMYSDSPLPRDLARACRVGVAAAPRSLVEWIRTEPKSPSLVWLPAIDANDREPELAALVRDWVDPLGTALAARAGLDVRLALSGRGRALSFAPRRPSLAARWRARLAPATLSSQLTVTGR
jgi:hypothetical protein